MMVPKGTSLWPVLTEYDQEHLTSIALPMGGIGTGTVSLGGRGDLRDWEVMNRPAKGFVPDNAFFALHAKPAGAPAVTRAIEGVLEPPYEGGCRGSSIPNGGLPRFRQCRFLTAYPFGQVLLADKDVPLEVRIEAFNPLIPGDSNRSGIPVVVLRYVLVNRTGKPVSASVCGSFQNFIGYDGKLGSPSKNINTFRTTKGRSGVRGVFMSSRGVDPRVSRP